MIIKNPYGFISKHYRLILLLLLIPLLAITLKFSDVAKFFRDYISSNYRTFETGIADKYMTGLTFISLIVMTTIEIFLGVIITSKKKNGMFHFICAAYFIVLLILSVLFYVTMNDIEIGTPSSTFIRFVRDMSNLSYIPGIGLLAFQAVKGIGFNVKSFRFERETGLEIAEDDEDDDSIEIKINNNKPSTTSGAVHLLRELKYYALENKFVIGCVCVVLLLVVLGTSYMNSQVYNKNVGVNQSFVLDNFTMSLKESYISDVDFRGNKIENGKYFLAVKLGIYNKSKTGRTIDNTNFRIFIGDEVIYPSYDRASRFVDIGRSYEGGIIHGYEADDFVLVYELNKNQLRNQYQLKVLSGLTEGETELKSQYKIINIRPTNLLKQQVIGKSEVGKEINFKGTILGQTKYTLNSFVIDTNYPYSYQACNLSKVCQNVSNTVVPRNGNMLAIIKDNLTFDETTSYYKNGSKDFYFDFVTIEYDYKISTGERHTSSILTNVTPSNVQGVRLYELPSNIRNGYNKTMIIHLRNQIVTIDLEK